ncbi:MAG: ribonuclease J [Actinobacteria bacterium]|nr:ribonuclease J [Actinomycetota bacterium]
MSAADDASPSPPVTITFLGGLGEIGRNMATIEVDGRIAVIDVGVSFPTAEHLGVDLILPDWSPLRERADDVVAVFLTHAHEDHVGALPFFLQDFPRAVVYGTRLTLAFIAAKLEEWPQLEDVRTVEIAPGDEVAADPFVVDVIQVSHSIPDGCAYAFRTPHGIVLHSGDFKLDQTPIDGRPTDLAHLARLGDDPAGPRRSQGGEAPTGVRRALDGAQHAPRTRARRARLRPRRRGRHDRDRPPRA